MNKQENKISFTDYVKANTDQDQFKIIDDEKNTPSLKEAQDFVGGMVECITFPNGDVLIINEEGKLIGIGCGTSIDIINVRGPWPVRAKARKVMPSFLEHVS